MKNIAFFDIDTQYDFMKKGLGLYIKDAEKIIPNLKRLTDFAAQRRIPIISSTDAHLKKDPEFKIFPAHCVIKTAGQKKIPQTSLKRHVVIREKKYPKKVLLKKIKDIPQIIVEKHKLDIFSNPNLKILLKGIKTVFVYGVATEYCVKKAVRGLLHYKKRVYLITDAIKEVSFIAKNKTLKELRQKGARFISTNKLLSFH